MWHDFAWERQHAYKYCLPSLGLDFTLFHPQNTRTCKACNPHVLKEIHLFPNLNVMNIPKIKRTTRPHYKACWLWWKFTSRDGSKIYPCQKQNVDRDAVILLNVWWQNLVWRTVSRYNLFWWEPTWAFVNIGFLRDIIWHFSLVAVSKSAMLIGFLFVY